jgi:hypothetical protein
LKNEALAAQRKKERERERRRLVEEGRERLGSRARKWASLGAFESLEGLFSSERAAVGGGAPGRWLGEQNLDGALAAALASDAPALSVAKCVRALQRAGARAQLAHWEKALSKACLEMDWEALRMLDALGGQWASVAGPAAQAERRWRQGPALGPAADLLEWLDRRSAKMEPSQREALALIEKERLAQQLGAASERLAPKRL